MTLPSQQESTLELMVIPTQEDLARRDDEIRDRAYADGFEDAGLFFTRELDELQLQIEASLDRWLDAEGDLREQIKRYRKDIAEISIIAALGAERKILAETALHQIRRIVG